MKCLNVFGIAAAVVGIGTCAFAEVKLGTPFVDGAILQRNANTLIWGTADAGEKVTVSFAGQTLETTADAKGEWRVRLAPMEASKESRVLKANNVEVKDVLVGEVWYCSGQSNTGLPLVGGVPHYSDREGRLVAALTRLPYVRYVYAHNWTFSTTPRKEAKYKVEWKKFTPENLGTDPSFSAMGVYFAMTLYSALDIPIGIVGSYWGGTPIETWTPAVGYENAPESLREIAAYKPVAPDKWNDSCKCKVCQEPVKQPSVLFNEHVAPWCPMTMKGMIWYQGCSNNGDGDVYREKMHALYKGWSKMFENPDLKLYFVQLAPYYDFTYPLLIAQAKFAEEEKNAGMVVTCDLGNPIDIHPAEKGPVGRRLAALALNRDYGWKDLEADSPTFRSAKVEGDTATLSFDHAEKGWTLYNADWSTDVAFELAGADGVYHQAWLVNGNQGKREAASWVTDGRINGTNLILRADGVAAPVKVRYLFQKPWQGFLYSGAGLPLGAFEADLTK